MESGMMIVLIVLPVFFQFSLVQFCFETICGLSRYHFIREPVPTVNYTPTEEFTS